MNIDESTRAIGEELTLEGRKYTIIGVVEDFHYERINYPIQNFGFRYDPSRFEVLNVGLESRDILTTMNKVEAAWKKVDTVHPIKAKFYSEHIENAYEKLSWIIKIVAFLAFLAITIASLGLLGMVVFINRDTHKRDQHSEGAWCFCCQPDCADEQRIHLVVDHIHRHRYSRRIFSYGQSDL